MNEYQLGKDMVVLEQRISELEHIVAQLVQATQPQETEEETPA